MLEYINQESGETKSFKYLDDLIHSGMDEITLEYDIILGEDEEELYENRIKFESVRELNGNGHTIDARYKARIFSINQNGLIKNLKFKRGLADKEKGVITLNDFFYFTFENCIFESNKSRMGVIYSHYSRKLHLKKCKFNKNDSSYTIIRSKAKRFFIDDCIFTDNIVNLRDYFSGIISIDNDNSKMIINNTVFSNNYGINGAVIHIGTNEKLSINNCSFEENVASMAGGAIYIENGNVTICESSFINNSTDSEEITETDCFTPYKGYSSEEIDEFMSIFDECGGAICNISGSVTILDSTFKGNKSANKGGGIYNRQGTVTIIKSTFSDNYAASYNENFFNYYGTLTLVGNDINTKSDKLFKSVCNTRGVLISLNDLDEIQFDEEMKNYIEPVICNSSMFIPYKNEEICEDYKFKKIDFTK